MNRINIPRLIYSLGFSVCTLLLTACASSQLNLQLSVYKEDPTYNGLLTKSDLNPTFAYLDSVKTSVGSVAQQQKELGQKMFDVYKEYWWLVTPKEMKNGKKYDRKKLDSQFKPLENQLSKYKEIIDAAASRIQRHVVLALQAANRLRDVLPEKYENVKTDSHAYELTKQRDSKLKQELKLTLSDVSNSYTGLLQLHDTDFQKSIRWKKLADRIYSKQVKSIIAKTKDKDALKKYNELSDKLQQLTKQLLDFKSNVVKVDSVLKSQLETAVKSGALDLFANMPSMMAQNPMIYKFTAEEESKRFHAFDLLNSELDRLQDPSSPYWRIVTDPANSNKWNTEFSRTYFYAQGNSGVVIVRDSPMTYRIQEGANNPAALVQAQLGVSRAIANAAIQIAGARAGVPLQTQGTSSTPGEAPKPGPNANYQSESDSLTAKQAMLKRELEIRDLAINNLKTSLRIKLDGIDKLAPQESKQVAEYQALLNQIIATLKGEKAFFSSLSPPATQ